MKRLFLIAAGAASLAAALPAAEALARDHGRGHERGYERGWAQREHGERGSRGWDDRRGRRHERPPPYERGYRNEGDERAAPPPRMLRAPGARRGGYLPDGYRGGVVGDYRAYRLRPPPRGFAWVRIGSGFALVDMADGRVYDMVR